MSALTGEIINTRLIKMPPPSGTAPLSNGWPVAANLAMIADSNTSVLVRESVRHLVTSLGPNGALVDPTNGFVWTTAGSQFQGVANSQSNSNTNTGGAYSWIPWGDRRSSVRFGPFYAAPDQNDGNGSAQIRLINCMIDITTSGTFSNAQLFFALTRSPSGTSLFSSGTYVDFAYQPNGGFNFNPSGHQQITQQLSQSGIWAASQDSTTKCRSGTTNATTGATGLTVDDDVFDFYVWFGWYFVSNAGAGFHINGFSVWETR